MVATTATAAFFPVPSSTNSSSSSSTSPAKLSSVSFSPKPASSNGGLQVKVNAQVATKTNRKTDPSKLGDDSVTTSPAPRTFYNQLPDWSVLLAAITTIFLAAEKQWTLIDWKPKRPDMLSDAFGLGKIIENGLVYRQNFSIRSYEIGADKTASIETLMNHLQETALNHVMCAGLMGDGFGSTPEMSKRNLIWVVTKMQVVFEHYPSWGDVIEVDTWVGSSGKHGMRRDWHVRDRQTGQTVMRATSNWVMMNKQTRKLSKFPEEVRAEIGPYFMERGPVIDEDNRKLPKLNDDTADHVRKGLTPRWSDLDANQHVNNVKYVGWILEWCLRATNTIASSEMTQSWFASSLLGSNYSRPPSSASSSSMSTYRAPDRPQSPYNVLPSPAEANGLIAHLKEKSIDDLRKLLTDKSAHEAFVNSLDQVKERNNLWRELSEETMQLARENLEKETRMSELRNQCRIIRTSELAAAQERLKELEKLKDEILRSYSPSSLLQNLQDAMNKVEEESEILHNKLIGKDIDSATFVQKYKMLRNTYHRRALTHLAARTSVA